MLSRIGGARGGSPAPTGANPNLITIQEVDLQAANAANKPSNAPPAAAKLIGRVHGRLRPASPCEVKTASKDAQTPMDATKGAVKGGKPVDECAARVARQEEMRWQVLAKKEAADAKVMKGIFFYEK